MTDSRNLFKTTLTLNLTPTQLQILHVAMFDRLSDAVHNEEDTALVDALDLVVKAIKEAKKVARS